MRRTSPNRSAVSTHSALLRERDRFAARLGQRAAPAAISLGVIFDASSGSEDILAAMKTMPTKMLGTARGLDKIALRFVHFGAFQASSTLWASDPAMLERQLAGVESSGAMTLPALVGFNEALAGFITGMERFRPAAVILIGRNYLQDPDAAVAAAHQLRQQGTKLYCFQRGNDPLLAAVFAHLAAMTGGRFVTAADGQTMEEFCEDVALREAGSPGLLRRVAGGIMRKRLP